jgi:hypothetical protein
VYRTYNHSHILVLQRLARFLLCASHAPSYSGQAVLLEVLTIFATVLILLLSFTVVIKALKNSIFSLWCSIVSRGGPPIFCHVGTKDPVFRARLTNRRNTNCWLNLSEIQINSQLVYLIEYLFLRFLQSSILCIVKIELKARLDLHESRRGVPLCREPAQKRPNLFAALDTGGPKNIRQIFSIWFSSSKVVVGTTDYGSRISCLNLNSLFALFVFLLCRLRNGAFTIDFSTPTLTGNLNEHSIQISSRNCYKL